MARTVNPAFSIRCADNKDIPEIKNHVFSVLNEYGLKPDPCSTDTDLDDIESYYFQGGGVFYVAVHNTTEIIGSFGLSPVDGQTCELRKMYLKETHRGKGIGRMMMERSMREAKDRGFIRMVLESATVLKEALGLYTSYGFREYTPPHLSSRCDVAFYLDLLDR